MFKFFAATMALAVAVTAAAGVRQTSPDGNLVLDVDVDSQGHPLYSLSYKGTPVVSDSRLGLEAAEARFADGFAITDTDTATVDQTWQPVWGEYDNVRDHYNELAVTFGATDSVKGRDGKMRGEDRLMTVRFRVFDDGLGFRYEFPMQDANYLAIDRELTQFNLSGDHTLYAIPGDYDTDEYLFSRTPVSKAGEAMRAYRGRHTESQAIDGGVTVQTPLLVKTADAKPLYVNIHEAALVNYPAMSLNVDTATYALSAHLTPDRMGVAGYVQIPFNTPWRTIIVSDDARDILASQLIMNLNEPSKIEDTSWIKPMKFVGVWWEMFTGTQKTWAYSDDGRAKPGITDYTKLKPNGRHPANTANVKRYIDFAARNGIDGVLVEGWNEGWEDWCSFRKNRQFLFDKPYPDFDVDSLRDYAAERGVQLIMHHETAANATDYERQLDRAFQYMKDNGYNAVKTGYVGAIIPRSEHHTSQWMVNHANHVAERAADYKIMIDSHEAPRPTGLCRTWPNWLAQESARGGEFESMGGNPPSHTCLLPFTRLKGGPMDYTPGLFETRLATYNEGKTGQAMTTLARQLALYVTMPSPLQMACDLPRNYDRFPDAFTFIREVPVDWSDSRFIEAEPYEYITVARRGKGTDSWYVGAITDENARTARVPLDFLEKGRKYKATVYCDAPDAHWHDNPQAYTITTRTVKAGDTLKLQLAPGGGAAVSIVPEK